MPASLPSDVVERLQNAFRELLPRFGKNPERAQSALAKRLGCSQPTISRILRRGQGGSIGLVNRVAAELNEPPEFLLRGGADKSRPRKLRELPGYEEAATDARRRIEWERPGLDPRALEYAGDAIILPPPAPVSAELLIQLALYAQQHQPLPSATSPPERRDRRASRIRRNRGQ